MVIFILYFLLEFNLLGICGFKYLHILHIGQLSGGETDVYKYNILAKKQ